MKTIMFRTWRSAPDAQPLFMIYPKQGGGALQITIWRRKFEWRWGEARKLWKTAGSN